MNPAHRILVIDDNRAIHDDFRKILCPKSDTALDGAEAAFFGGEPPGATDPTFEVESAYQGEEGCAAVERSLAEGRPFALVFLDVRMPPGIDGIETAERLWQLAPDLHIVICTAYSDYSWEEMIARLGRSDRLLVLKKPFASVEALQLACALAEKWRLSWQARRHLEETERIVAERTRELRATNLQLAAEMEQRAQAEQHLLRAQRLESIGTLASGLAHDLNNMLSPILLSAQLLHRPQPAAYHESLVSTIESSAERAAGVVRQVLTFARGIDGERIPLRPRQVIHDVAKIIGDTFPPNITIRTEFAEDLWLVEGDMTQAHQVLMNLCLNARDAMPSGGTLLIEAANTEIDAGYASMVSEAGAGCYVRLRVSDTGEGIPREVLDRIFDPFFTTKLPGKGTGLGLSSVAGIVKSHGGFIEVRSEVGAGSQFEIFLPAVARSASQVKKTERAPAHGNGEFILVVDDESEILSVTVSTLANRGYRVIGAADGTEALSIFAGRKNDIDVVVTDLLMPVLSGAALCRALRKINPEVRIIAATGCHEEAQSPELEALNLCSVLQKPFHTNALLTAVSQAVAPRSTVQPAGASR